MISAALVKELREKTGAGIMDCKSVLTETNGDMEKAAVLLREKGITKAAKKTSRIAAEGLVYCYVSEDKKVGVVLEVNSETDFVARNDEFRKFVADIAVQITKTNPENVESLLEEKSLEDSSRTVKDLLTDKIATIGENISIRRFERFVSEGLVGSYIHGDGKIGVLVDSPNGKENVVKDVCMQIAATKPEYLNRESVPQDVLEREMDILKAQAMNEGKPAEIAEKIVKGRIVKFYQETCLLEQDFVKDSDIKVQKFLDDNDTEIARFVRFERGEGLQKREENFAEEIAKQMN